MRFVLAVAVLGFVLGIVAGNWISVGFFAACIFAALVEMRRSGR